MKAIVKCKAGPEEIAYMEVQKPKVDPGGVLIQVEIAGICGSDLRLKSIGNSMSLIPPVVMGHEFAGIIVETGVEQFGFTVGMRVVSDNSGYICGLCENCATGDYMACEDRKILGLGMNGGFAKYVLVPGQVLRRNPNALFQVPDGVDFDEAVFMDPLGNAYKAVVQEGRLMPGQNVVVYGLGTIGLLAVQIARVAGAGKIIAVNRSKSPVKLSLARKFGADIVLTAEDGNVAERVLEQTNGARVPLVVDCAGSNEILYQALMLLQKNGKFVKVGYDQNPVGFSLDPYVARGIQIIGHYAYDYRSCSYCLKLLQSGQLNVKPLITEILPLEEWKQAFEVADRRDSIKVLLKP